jgi:peptidoglycan/LPS O-acetylase OafA/YrhL
VAHPSELVEAPRAGEPALAAPVDPVRAQPRRWYALELLDNRYPALHGLRFFAILSVIQFHVTWIFSGEQGIYFDRSLTGVSLSVFFGMDLFFILSGFLIGSILFHSIDTAGKTQLGRFYLRRIFRTFPSYYLVLTVLALITVLSDQQRAHLIYEYTYLTNFMPLGRRDVIMFWGWSLGLEEQFYLVVPLFLFVLSRLGSDRARVLLLAGLCLIAAGIRLSIYWSHYPWTDLALYGALYFRTFTRFDTLITGILLALIMRRWSVPIRAWLAAPLHRAMLALPALTLFWVLLFPNVVGGQNVQLLHVFAWGTLTSLMYLPTLILLLCSDGFFSRALSHPAFRVIATLGYGVYLVHIPIVDQLVVPWAHHFDHRHVSKPLLWGAAFLVTVACSWAIAYVLHVLVEKPALKLRDKLAS